MFVVTFLGVCCLGVSGVGLQVVDVNRYAFLFVDPLQGAGFLVISLHDFLEAVLSHPSANPQYGRGLDEQAP